MMRFIDLRGQGTGYRFAFCNTATDHFVNIDGKQSWDTWGEFAEFFYIPRVSIQRFRSLCPAWVFEPLSTDENNETA